MYSPAFRHSQHSHTAKALNLCVAMFILVWCVLFVGSAPAQTRPTATPSPEAKLDATREDRELTEARRRNEDAQAAYYQKQTEKLNQPAPSKSFWRTLSENAAILGALTAALVALFTLVVNQRTALRARKDTEFYEALKRFGDQDSPTLRASAAGLLNEMSKISVFALRWRRSQPWWRPHRKMLRYPYFDTALEQLITALRLEENHVVLASIVNNLELMMPNNIRRSAELLRSSNLELQEEMGSWLAELFASRVTAVKELQQTIENTWREAVSLTTFPRNSLELLVNNFEKEAAIFNALDFDQKRAHLGNVQLELERVGSRLRKNIYVCIKMFERRPEHSARLPFTSVFMADTVFPQDANLQDLDLSHASLQKAEFFRAKLQRTSFQGATLHDAVLMNADLAEAKLAGAQIDESTNLKFTKWWKADFALPDAPIERVLNDTTWGGIDLDLLINIIEWADYELTFELIQGPHFSIRGYLEALQRTGGVTVHHADAVTESEES